MARHFVLSILSIALLATIVFAPAQTTAAIAPCTVATFQDISPSDTTITLVQSYAAGTYPSPVGTITVPICRVAATITPAIKFEVWMPTTNWNGKLEGIGNGGLAGSISYSGTSDRSYGADLHNAINRYYAAVSTDTGHQSNAAGDEWWTNAQKIKDYGYRSIHEMTVKAKAFVWAFYGMLPRRSYFNGCSTGGRQAFMEAQRYPDDYDGIIAGSPVFRVLNLRSRHVWTWQCNWEDVTGVNAIPFSTGNNKLQTIFNAVTARCDALDGLVDGQVDDPRRCDFNPDSLLCPTGVDNVNCLTAPQVQALKCMYAGPGANIYPGIQMSSELDQGQSIGVVPNPQYTTFFANTVFWNVPNYDFRTFTFPGDVNYTLNEVWGGETLDYINTANSPDLRDFKSRGGKMIVWHGWSDPLPNPVDTIRYYNSLQAFMSANSLGSAGDFFRVFLPPNIGHCAGAAPGGPNNIDPLTLLERWRELDIAPDKMIASRIDNNGVVTRTRPICPYPQVARYVGRGSIDDANNFVCVEVVEAPPPRPGRN